MPLPTPPFISPFTDVYRNVHAPLVVALCVLGCLANVVNVIVLSRKNMLANSINIILCGLSIAQLLLLTNYLVYTLYTFYYDGECSFYSKTYSWLLYILINVNFNLIAHTIALLHTVLLGVCRYLVIHYPGKSLINTRRAKKAVLCIFTLVPLVCSSFYANSQITQMDLSNCSNFNMSSQIAYRLVYTSNTTLFAFNFWFFGVVCKLMPCLCLTVVVLLLVADLSKATRRRRRLNMQPTDGKTVSHTDRQHANITRLLLTILTLFIVVELPQGLFNIVFALQRINALFMRFDFANEIYGPLGDLFEMLTVLYSSVNFILYCFMSSQFRDTFKKVFIPKICFKKSLKKVERSTLYDTEQNATLMTSLLTNESGINKKISAVTMYKVDL